MTPRLISTPRAAQALFFWHSCRLALSGDPGESMRGLVRIRAIRDAAEAPLLRAQAAGWLETYIGGGYDVLPVAEVRDAAR